MINRNIKKIPVWKEVKLFIFSYSGFAAILGSFCLIFSIGCACFVMENEQSNWIPFIENMNAVALSIVASCVFYFITVYFPKRHRKRIEEKYIREWIQQLKYFGEQLIGDIADIDYDKVKECSHETFKNRCNKDFTSSPKKEISLRERKVLNSWFDYFDNFFYYENIYMEQVAKYGSSVPAEVLVEFEKYNQFDNLKLAIYQYKNSITYNPEMYKNMANLEKLIWMHAQSLMSLPDLYINHSRE
jgi:hypothetical protein